MRQLPPPLPLRCSSACLAILLLLLASSPSLANGRAAPSWSPGGDSLLAEHVRDANGTASVAPAVPAPPPIGRSPVSDCLESDGAIVSAASLFFLKKNPCIFLIVISILFGGKLVRESCKVLVLFPQQLMESLFCFTICTREFAGKCYLFFYSSAVILLLLFFCCLGSCISFKFERGEREK